MNVVKYLSNIASARKKKSPVIAELAGDLGESKVCRSLKRCSGIGSHVFQGTRVPSSNSSKLYEIDIIALSPFGLFVIEVKNWGGEIFVEKDGCWGQISSRGQRRSHQDPIGANRKKK